MNEMLMMIMAAALAVVVAAGDAVKQIEVVSDAQMWSLIVGFGMPLLISVIQQPRWRNTVRVAVAVAASVIAGAGTSYFAGDFTGRSWLSCALIVCVTAIATYQHLWKPSTIAPKIEAATSPGNPQVRIVRGPGDTEDVVVDDPGVHRGP